LISVVNQKLKAVKPKKKKAPKKTNQQIAPRKTGKKRTKSRKEVLEAIGTSGKGRTLLKSSRRKADPRARKRRKAVPETYTAKTGTGKCQTPRETSEVHTTAELNRSTGRQIEFRAGRGKEARGGDKAAYTPQKLRRLISPLIRRHTPCELGRADRLNFASPRRRGKVSMINTPTVRGKNRTRPEKGFQPAEWKTFCSSHQRDL